MYIYYYRLLHFKERRIKIHLHLEGAIPLEALWELIQKYGGDKSVIDYKQMNYSVVGEVSKQFQLSFKYFLIGLPLVFNILPDKIFIAILTYCICIITIGPKFYYAFLLYAHSCIKNMHFHAYENLRFS
ncbi:hypothetical protein ES705_50414 [subsurface metagenome]